MSVRAVRGAVTVNENSENEILEKTADLLKEIVERNQIHKNDIVSVLFSMTSDLDAVFPAVAARRLGWTDIALMCTNEISVPGSIRKCVRVLVHINSDMTNSEVKHVYLGGAKVLRPDLDD